MRAPASSWAQILFRIIITWAVVFPLVTAMSVALASLVPAAPVALRSLLMTGLLVPVMVVAIGPLVATWAQRLFAHPSGRIPS